MFGVVARLGPKIMLLDDVTGKPKPKPLDYDFWLECRKCGSLYQKYEVKVEPDLDSVKVLSDGRQGKIQGIEKKRKAKGKGNNPRLKNNRGEIKDEDLLRELKDGAQLISYYTNEPLK
jgi:hypothetical protein